MATNPIVVDAGDQFQGSLYYTQYRGLEAADYMPMLGYQAMAVGNHEFDDGPANLAKFIDAVGLPVLSANIDASADPDLAGKIAASTQIVKLDANENPPGDTVSAERAVIEALAAYNFLSHLPRPAADGTAGGAGRVCGRAG